MGQALAADALPPIDGSDIVIRAPLETSVRTGAINEAPHRQLSIATGRTERSGPAAGAWDRDKWQPAESVSPGRAPLAEISIAREGACTDALRELRAQGIGIAFDDFGTGYVSLSLLEDFPLTRLKIDRSFVQKMNNAPDVPVIRAILQLAKGLGLDVVAEGIETEDQLRGLRKKGCSEGQGYLFGRPVPADRFEQTFIHSGLLPDGNLRRIAWRPLAGVSGTEAP